MIIQFIDRIFVEVVPKFLSEDPLLIDFLKSLKKHAVSSFASPLGHGMGFLGYFTQYMNSADN